MNTSISPQVIWEKVIIFHKYRIKSTFTSINLRLHIFLSISLCYYLVYPFLSPYPFHIVFNMVMFEEDEETQITNMSDDLLCILERARTVTDNPLNDEIKATSEILLNILTQVANGADFELFRGPIENLTSIVRQLNDRLNIERIEENIEIGCHVAELTHKLVEIEDLIIRQTEELEKLELSKGQHAIGSVEYIDITNKIQSLTNQLNINKEWVNGGIQILANPPPSLLWLLEREE